MNALNYAPFLLIAILLLVFRSLKDNISPDTQVKLLYFSFGYIVHGIVATLIKAL